MGFFRELLGKRRPPETTPESPSDPADEAAPQLEAIAALMQTHAYAEAIEKLEALKATTEAPSVGAAVLRGRLGECQLQSGHADLALAHFDDGLAMCESMDDKNGVQSFLGSRLETLRYLGRHIEASAIAELLGDIYEGLGAHDHADRIRARARIMAAGEPLVRATLQIDGQVYELGDLPTGIEGEAQVMIERDRMTLAPSQRLLEEGRARASAGATDAALTALAGATDADPKNPEPHYAAAEIHAALGEYDKSIAAYDEVERLAPGWFTCRSDRWLIAKVKAGVFAPDVLPILVELETGVSGATEKEQMARILTERIPRLPHGWLHLGRALRNLGRMKDAELAFEDGIDCADEPDIRTRLLFEFGATDPRKNREELEEAVELKGHLVAHAMATLVVSVTKPEPERA